MARRERTLVLIVFAAVVLAFAAGCSRSGGGTPPASSAGAGGGQRVVLKDFSFQPASIEVTAGTKVTWENQDPTEHTVTSDDNVFTSPKMSQGSTFSFTFDKPGTYKYHCVIHPSMVGQVVVK